MRTLLVIGPEPPPVTGMEVATKAMIDELRAAGVPLARVDTAQRLAGAAAPVAGGAPRLPP